LALTPDDDDVLVHTFGVHGYYVSVHGPGETSVYCPGFVYEGAATAVSVSTGSKPRRAGGQEFRHAFRGGNFSTRFSLSGGQHFGM